MLTALISTLVTFLFLVIYMVYDEKIYSEGEIMTIRSLIKKIRSYTKWIAILYILSMSTFGWYTAYQDFLYEETILNVIRGCGVIFLSTLTVCVSWKGIFSGTTTIYKDMKGIIAAAAIVAIIGPGILNVQSYVSEFVNMIINVSFCTIILIIVGCRIAPGIMENKDKIRDNLDNFKSLWKKIHL